MGQYDGTDASREDSGGSSSSSPQKSTRWKDSKTAGGLRSAGSSLMSSGQSELDRASSERITPVAYKHGGKIRKAKRKMKRPMKSRD
jgi:hypothetical protein